ncbi:hypothetical protein CMV_012384 [Castanea mollissima]|uniref:Uncharacterized protein n=1 Tax=Castanea mollissima TaxID=60419 RepID=A0A8J4VW54_9ROSI|nr:hypothetical protein CMV_012384 [Castanea mollissima]
MPTTLDVRRLGKMETAICINDLVGVGMFSQFANMRLGNLGSVVLCFRFDNLYFARPRFFYKRDQEPCLVPLVGQFYFSILTLLVAEIRFAYYKRLQREYVIYTYTNISARPY